MYEQIKDIPVGLWPLTANYSDYSGYNRNGTLTGTAGTNVGLANGFSNSRVLNPATLSLPSPVFRRGKESDSFSLECWARTISRDATFTDLKIMSHGTDGLIINGNKVIFRLDYLVAPRAEVVYDMQIGHTAHIVAVKNQNKIALFVDGELRVELPLTEEQQRDLFSSTDTNLYAGNTTGSQSVALNGLAVYPYAMDFEAISRHYASGVSGLWENEVPSSYGGEDIEVSLNNANIFMDYWWQTKEDWTAAELIDTVVVDDSLRPQFSDNISLPGTWTDSVPISSSPAPLEGLSLNWDGEGVTIQASIDEITWETAERGKALAIIPKGFDTTGKQLLVRATFDGGVLNDTSYLDNLNVVATTAQASSRVLITNGFQERSYKPQLLSDNWGAEVNGNIKILADTTEPKETVKTIQAWIKNLSTSGYPTITSSTSIGQAKMQEAYGQGTYTPNSNTAGVSSDRYTTLGTYTTNGGVYRYTLTDAGAGTFGFHLANNPDLATVPATKAIAVVPGEVIKIRGSWRSSSTVPVYIQYKFWSSSAALSNSSILAVTPVSNEWSSFDINLPAAPATSVAVSVSITQSLPANSTGATLDLYDVMINNTSVSQSYTVFRDGAASNLNIPTGEWSLVHIVSGLEIDGDITINGPVQIGALSVYDNALGLSEVQEIYKQYMGTSTLSVLDTSDVNVSESNVPVRIYDTTAPILASG